MAKTLLENKKEFVDLLRSTGRDGIDDVIEYLERDGFFTAPASSTKHLNTEGGLVEHSLNVYHTAVAIWEALKPITPSIATDIQPESIIIAALLHDVCKIDIYKRTVVKRKVLGQWEDAEGYKCSYKDFPMGHGEKSLVLLLCQGLEMSDDEMLAIRWHMGAWGVNLNSWEETKNYDSANKQYPLVSLIHSADNLAANLVETTAKDLEDL